MAGLSLPRGALYEDLCFHAQQAAEKAIKAVYRALGLQFRYTHDIADLLNGLRQADAEVPNDVLDAIDLTEFAGEARYPRLGEPTTQAEYRRCLAVAEAVVRWADAIVGKQTP
jgi:HEPN domain-containing protein